MGTMAKPQDRKIRELLEDTLEYIHLTTGVRIMSVGVTWDTTRTVADEVASSTVTAITMEVHLP